MEFKYNKVGKAIPASTIFELKRQSNASGTFSTAPQDVHLDSIADSYRGSNPPLIILGEMDEIEKARKILRNYGSFV